MQRKQLSYQSLWLRALLVILFGYALLGKGFAYLFMGEFILILGAFVFIRSQRVMLLFSDGVLLLWACFAFWGFCRTIPYISQYHFDAIRDAVLWGYGTFAVLIASFVNSSEQISHALNTYRRFLRWYLPVLPFLLLVSIVFRAQMPTIPWSDGVGILFLKIGDTAVHLTAAGLFLLIFPDRKDSSQQGTSVEKQSIPIYRLVGFVGWSLTAMISMAAGRTGLLDVVVPFFLVSVLKAQKIGWKVLALAVPVVLLALMVLETNLVTVKFNGSRSLTADQILANMGSITGNSDAAGLDGTKEWRLIWWHNIINYTVFGPYFWTGKGFGVNLAQVDGPPGITQDEVALRSPHNGNMTVLARMGVPGIVMWAALHITFVFRLVNAYLRANRLGLKFWSNVNLWILCYWLGSFLNMSFDVYIEGPQGGIWFWSIIGLGVAALRVQAYEVRQMRVQSQTPEYYSSDPEHSLVVA